MKKILATVVCLSILAVPTIVFGVDWLGWLLGGETAPEEAPATDFLALLNSLTNWLFAILLIIAAIAIIIAAYFFVTATGDPDKTKKARDFVLYALIGVLVAFAAKGLVRLVYLIVLPAKI